MPTLLRPENKAMPTGVLTYHAVPGRLDFASLSDRIRAGGGTTSLSTVQGTPLTAMMNGPRDIVLRDAAGNVARIGTYDVIHVIDRVLMPRG